MSVLFMFSASAILISVTATNHGLIDEWFLYIYINVILFIETPRFKSIQKC